MQAKLRDIARRMPEQAKAALLEAAEVIMTRSKSEFVPVDLGNLRSSGFVRPPVRGPGRLIEVELVYGGTAAPYALAVHEHPSIFDPPSWRGTTVNFNIGGPKYLERPLMEAVPTLAQDIGRRLKLDRWAR